MLLEPLDDELAAGVGLAHPAPLGGGVSSTEAARVHCFVASIP